MNGKKFGRKLVKPLRIERNRNGQKKNRNSTMLEKWEEFTLSIEMTRNTKKFSWLWGENWKDLWHLLCRVKGHLRASEKPVLIKWQQSRTVHQRKIRKRCSVVWWNLTKPTRQRAESSQSKNHEDHIVWRGFTSMSPYNLVHKFIPMSQAMKIMSPQNAELGLKIQKFKGRVVLRGETVKGDSGASAVFTEQGSSASQMTAAKIMDVIARLPGCDGQAADAVAAYTQVKLEDAARLLNISKTECPEVWIRLPRHKWPKSWAHIEDPVVPLERNSHGHPLAGVLWETIRGSFAGTWMGKQYQIGKVCSFFDQQKLCLSVYVDGIRNGWK